MSSWSEIVCGISAYASGNRAGYSRVIGRTLSLLIELQHRGQESVGIGVVSVSGDIKVVKKGSLVLSLYEEVLGNSNIKEQEVFGCIAHTRYSTSGRYGWELAHPELVSGGRLKLAIAFNGNIANYRDLFALARSLAPEYTPSYIENDTQALAYAVYALAKDEGWDVVEALKRLPEYIIGAYSLVALTSEPRLLVARDPRGIRPLAYSYIDKEVYVASETAALQVLNLDWREVGAGEILSFDGSALEATDSVVAPDPSPCVFEYVYFSRPDSYFNGVSVYLSRLKMGWYLAREAPAEADVVVPVPDSGRIAAIGYSMASGIPLAEGIIVNKYVGRVFISAPDQRDGLSKIKYGVVRPAVEGKRVVVVDDSIVRGTTMRFLLDKLRRGGATKLYVRIASPPFTCPCYMGIDVTSGRELLLWSKSSVEEVGRSLGTDSLAYNSLRNLELSVGLPKVCHGCFSCSYPFSELRACDLEKMFSR
ncbi:MAG: amidophosphoribosyltransferase [Sulfolobales archaeon]